MRRMYTVDLLRQPCNAVICTMTTMRDVLNVLCSVVLTWTSKTGLGLKRTVRCRTVCRVLLFSTVLCS